MKFHHVVCGGTFDHFHLGHKKLLLSCFQNGEEVTIGITSGAMARHKPYHYSLQSYETRKKSVLDYAAQQKKQVEIVKINDIYGPTVENSSFEALFVTKDTQKGAEAINKKRIKAGMKPLLIQVVPFELDSRNEKISSEKIRQGIINREGIRYDAYLISRDKYILPESLKGVLRKPLGHVISSLSHLSKQKIDEIKQTASIRGDRYLCAIGDIMTLELKKRGIAPFFSIIDGQTKRKALNTQLLKLILEKDRCDAINKKGMIERNACIEVLGFFDAGHGKAIKQILIHGEEDILTLVVVLVAPLGCVVWYGQKGRGAICVKVTEEKKRRVYNLLQQFG